MFIWFFGYEAYWILAPWPRINPLPPALEGEDFTTGPPGKSLDPLRCKISHTYILNIVFFLFFFFQFSFQVQL